MRNIESCWLVKWNDKDEVIAILDSSISKETIKNAIEFYYATSECNALEMFSNNVLSKSNYSGVHETNETSMSCGGNWHHITAQKIKNVAIIDNEENEYYMVYNRNDGEKVKLLIKNKEMA